MSFDEIPENKIECYPCPACDKGNLCETKKDYWECNNCSFKLDKRKGKINATV